MHCNDIPVYWHCPLSVRSRVYLTVGCPSVCLSVCLSVCPVIRPQQLRAAGLLLSAVLAGDIAAQRRSPSSNGAAARPSAANAGSVMLIAELTRLNTTHLLIL